MACACKVNQEIAKIQKYYPYNGKDRDKDKPKMSINKKDAATTIFIYMLLLPLMPFVMVGVIFHSAFSKNKMISFKKFLGFIHKTRNGRK